MTSISTYFHTEVKDLKIVDYAYLAVIFLSSSSAFFDIFGRLPYALSYKFLIPIAFNARLQMCLKTDLVLYETLASAASNQ